MQKTKKTVYILEMDEVLLEFKDREIIIIGEYLIGYVGKVNKG